MQGLKLDRVSIALGGQELLSVSPDVPQGETLTVMGPSGSGKSSLLAYIGGFLGREFLAAGRVFSDEVEITGMPAEDRHAGLLFQDPLLFPHMSVAGNVAFALPGNVKGRAARRVHAEQALADVDLVVDVELHQKVEFARRRINLRRDLGVGEAVRNLIGLSELAFDLDEEGDHSKPPGRMEAKVRATPVRSVR